MKRNLPSISAILYLSKTLANGEHPIMLRVSYNGQRKYKSLGFSCSEKLWNEKKQEVRLGHPMALNMNTIIRNEIDKANKFVMSLEGQEDYSANSIIKTITKTAPTKHTLFSLFEERIDYFKNNTHKYNTATGYKTLLNVIKRFNNNEDIDLFSMTKGWVKDFEEYLRTKYTDNSIRKFFDCLKAIMNYAIAHEYLKASPLQKYTFSSKLDCHTQKKALTVLEMTTLMQYYHDTYGWFIEKKRPNLEKTKVHYWNSRFKPRGTTKLAPIDAEEFALALFMCSYMLQGLALIDLAKLKKKDLKIINVVNEKKWAEDAAEYGTDYANNHQETTEFYEIYIKRNKTSHPARILCEAENLWPFLNPFGSIVNGSEDEEELEEYIFPIYDNNNDDEYTKYKRMRYAIYLINVNLRRVALKAGIRDDITFYAARHSYASNLYHANVPVGLIAQNMGRNPSDIETYLKEFDTTNIINANKKALITGQDDYKLKYEELRKKRSEEKQKRLKAMKENK